MPRARARFGAKEDRIAAAIGCTAPRTVGSVPAVPRLLRLLRLDPDERDAVDPARPLPTRLARCAESRLAPPESAVRHAGAGRCGAGLPGVRGRCDTGGEDRRGRPDAGVALVVHPHDNDDLRALRRVEDQAPRRRRTGVRRGGATQDSARRRAPEGRACPPRCLRCSRSAYSSTPSRKRLALGADRLAEAVIIMWMDH